MITMALMYKWDDLLARTTKLLWTFACLITLGFAPKYYRKVQGWQIYDVTNHTNDRKPYEDHVNSSGLGMKSSKRAKQQVGE
jgi:hypothetical protein